MRNNRDNDELAKPKRLWPVVRRGALIALFSIFVFFAGVLFWAGIRLFFVSQTEHVRRPIEDCIASAAPDCVRSSIEIAQQRDFRGYHYCACVLSNGLVAAYMAVDSTVHGADDTAARAEAIPPLGNDNPAVTFPVGAKHR